MLYVSVLMSEVGGKVVLAVLLTKCHVNLFVNNKKLKGSGDERPIEVKGLSSGGVKLKSTASYFALRITLMDAYLPFLLGLQID